MRPSRTAETANAAPQLPGCSTTLLALLFACHLNHMFATSAFPICHTSKTQTFLTMLAVQQNGTPNIIQNGPRGCEEHVILQAFNLSRHVMSGRRVLECHMCWVSQVTWKHPAGGALLWREMRM